MTRRTGPRRVAVSCLGFGCLVVLVLWVVPAFVLYLAFTWDRSQGRDPWGSAPSDSAVPSAAPIARPTLRPLGVTQLREFRAAYRQTFTSTRFEVLTIFNAGPNAGTIEVHVPAIEEDDFSQVWRWDGTFRRAVGGYVFRSPSLDLSQVDLAALVRNTRSAVREVGGRGGWADRTTILRGVDTHPEVVVATENPDARVGLLTTTMSGQVLEQRPAP